MFANLRLSGIATRVVLASVLAVLPATTALAQAQAPRAQAPGVDIPFTATAATGEVINATFTVQRFVQRDGQILAVGKVTGTATNAAGVVTNFVTQLSAPVTSATTASCEILNLVLGPLDLNLLGLVVHLDQVVLNITAVPGAGNLLGNLLCAVAGLLDGGLGNALAGITALLNQILGILG